MRRAAALAGAALALAGCAARPAPVDAGEEALACRRVLQEMDRRVEAAGVRDGGEHRVRGFPYLRADRALAALASPPQGAGFQAWLARLGALDRAAREAEMANLGAAPAEREQVLRCAARLAALELRQPGARRALLAAVAVPDEYSLGARVLGLYPLAAVGLLAGMDLLRAGIDADFRVPLQALPVRGRLVRFVPPGAHPPPPAAHGVLPLDALGLPSPSAQQLQALFERHAPVLEVDVVRPDDRVGEVRLDAGGLPEVNPARPVLYRRSGLARLDGRVLLTLEYVAWFASRPLTGALDILGGRLDGLVWRVILDRDGEVLAYDSIHPCGCYHLVFPGARLVARPPPRRFEEPLLVPQAAPAGAGRIVLRLAERSHFIQRVYRDGERGGVAYHTRAYDTLRSLPHPAGGRRSMFGPDGLVAGTERAERWLLWMAGIASPGAMRQQGRHAIAFVGRRHFDDPDLLGRFLSYVPP